MMSSQHGSENISDDTEIDKETENVMKARVSGTSRKNYLGRNITFILWLFDNRNKYGALLEALFLIDLGHQHAVDQNTLNHDGTVSKRRKMVRSCIKTKLLSIRAGVEATFPVILRNLTFTIVSRYLGTFKKTIKKTNGMNRDNCAGRNNVTDNVVIRLSPNTYDGVCSALSHLYIECGLNKLELSPELWRNLSMYKKGSRRVSATEKKEHGLKILEGKSPLSFPAYKFLCEILFKSEKLEHVAAHTFLTME